MGMKKCRTRNDTEEGAGTGVGGFALYDGLFFVKFAAGSSSNSVRHTKKKVSKAFLSKLIVEYKCTNKEGFLKHEKAPTAPPPRFEGGLNTSYRLMFLKKITTFGKNRQTFGS